MGLRGNLQPEMPCKLNGREFCARINCKENTVDILQEHAVLNFICPSRNNFNDRHIFGQGDNTNDDIDKNGTKIHIVSQLDPCT